MDEKAYTNVVDMVRDITGDGDLAQEVQSQINRRHIITQLLAVRAARGISQADVAAAMNCSQSRISKLESGQDDEVRYGDLRKYAAVLDCTLHSDVEENR